MTIIDVVLWDSHPLTLGATPTQVFIDGIPQLDHPYIIKKSSERQKVPQTPNFTEGAKAAVKHDGLPPLDPTRSKAEVVVFTNVSEIYVRKEGQIEMAYKAKTNTKGIAVVVQGELVCYGPSKGCELTQYGADTEYVDLEGGSIS